MESLFQENPYHRFIHENWYLFRISLSTFIENYVPSKIIRPHKDVPWLTHRIKQKMKTRNKIYIWAKCNQNESDWAKYRQIRNEVNNLMKEYYNNYCKHLFDNSYSDNHKRFWSLIKSLCKDYSSIASLNIGSKCVTDPPDEAEALNNQFFIFLQI